MELRKYLSEERGRAAKLAAEIVVSAVTVHQWEKGIKQVPFERCDEIERATGGRVTCEELRPDLAEKWAYFRGTSKQHAERESQAA